MNKINLNSLNRFLKLKFAFKNVHKLKIYTFKNLKHFFSVTFFLIQILINNYTIFNVNILNIAWRKNTRT